MLAYLTSIPEFALDEEKQEHEKIARAIARVARHYDIPVLEAKTRDWLMLCKTLGIIYGSRIIAYNLRTRGDAAKTVKPAATISTRSQPATPQSERVQQTTSPPPTKAPKQEPQFAEVVVPGFEHLGPQRVAIQ
jgi:hypothetical protein